MLTGEIRAPNMLSTKYAPHLLNSKILSSLRCWASKMLDHAESILKTLRMLRAPEDAQHPHTIAVHLFISLIVMKADDASIRCALRRAAIPELWRWHTHVTSGWDWARSRTQPFQLHYPSSLVALSGPGGEPEKGICSLSLSLLPEQKEGATESPESDEDRKRVKLFPEDGGGRKQGSGRLERWALLVQLVCVWPRDRRVSRDGKAGNKQSASVLR